MVNWVALAVFVVLFAFVTILGFLAARWRAGDLDLLHEWGLAGRRFGTIVTWFLLGGDASSVLIRIRCHCSLRFHGSRRGG